ncbi:MAG: HAMP domain-containing sensor histidine kinase [Campylobacterota bacterium]|nr:HAMP domain-containing sensor histidine kinase [Campylobacterota bacterium]
MFSQRSIRDRFLIQIIVASAALIFILTSVLYLFIEKSIYSEKSNRLVQIAQNITSFKSLSEAINSPTDSMLGISIELINFKNKRTPKSHEIYEHIRDSQTYLTLIYPFNFKDSSYLKIEKNITPTKRLLKKILKSIIILNLLGSIVIIVYAVALSRMLIAPVKTLSRRLSNMNENLINPIKVETLPEEFEPLGETINRLLSRIETFVKYQKELFIGAAHELKTPLAVIKLKNQVTLIKEREAASYIEAIKKTNESVDNMNKIVADILNIGRQEGAQLELPTQCDIIEIIQQKGSDFKLLAHSEDKELVLELEPSSFTALIQVNLLNQILQNFLQNAIKFTQEGKKVLLKSRLVTDGLIIEVIDEGCGINDEVDLFAPFKREGDKSGVGLGLFLAKSAAEAIGAEIKISNREDGVVGTIASLHLYSKLCCQITHKNKN